MSIWKKPLSIAQLRASNRGTLVEHLGIEITEVGDDFLKGTMPVDHRTLQPAGLLHGGASVSLAETLGSMASFMMIEDTTKKAPVGLEINANHMRSARSGIVTAICTPKKLGQNIHVWNIDIFDKNEKIICTSRLTVMIIDVRQ